MPDIRDHIRNWLTAVNMIEVSQMMEGDTNTLSFQLYRPSYVREAEDRYLKKIAIEHQWEDPKEAQTSPS